MGRGTTKISTKIIIAELEKASRKRKQKIWLEIAKIISKPRRIRPSINLWRLEKLAKKNTDKIFLIPGKVLGYGNIETKAEVAALEFSEKAKNAIQKNGKTYSLMELLEKEVKPSKIMIVK
ncbi:MAG: 50S ribosomal protein L18e [Candidatus Diapherotrites archaeon]